MFMRVVATKQLVVFVQSAKLSNTLIESDERISKGAEFVAEEKQMMRLKGKWREFFVVRNAKGERGWVLVDKKYDTL